MSGSPSNFNNVYGVRTDILLVNLGVGIFAVLVGGLIAIVGGVIPFFLYSFSIAALMILSNYRLGVWLLVFLLPFATTQLIPRQVFGVTGLNPINGLLAVTLLSLCLTSLFGRRVMQFIHLPRVLLVYVVVIALAASVGAGSVQHAIAVPGVEPLTLNGMSHLNR
jgi:hypothetical protein